MEAIFSGISWPLNNPLVYFIFIIFFFSYFYSSHYISSIFPRAIYYLRRENREKEEKEKRAAGKFELSCVKFYLFLFLAIHLLTTLHCTVEKDIAMYT